jgi:predicted AAA+ superfamily ATPase
MAAIELTPFLVDEVGDDSASRNRLWERGGFPDSYLAATGAASRRWRQQFISTYLERDIPLLGPRIPAETLRRFWTMLAHRQGELMNAAAIATGLSVSGQTVARYLDLMVDLLLVRRLPPWTEYAGKRLVRSPKIYLRDPGVVHALLGIDDYETLLGHPVVGGSWEGWVVENLIAAAPEGTQAWFYRTAAGAEIDLVLEISSRERWATYCALISII